MEPARQTNGTKNSLLVLSISLAIFMGSLDGTIVNIALPTISEAFHISTSLVSWVSTAYLLVLAGCVLVFGKISDVIGFKRVFLAGFTIFTIGSLACGLLPDMFSSFELLIVSRIFQAVGGAMMTGIAPAMIAAYIPKAQKGKAMGIVMTLAALGTALGPALGGFLTQYLSWHWIFFINIPVGIFAVILGSRVIPGSERGHKLQGFDWTGSALIFAGLATLLFAVSEGQALGWTDPIILLMLALSIITITAFVRHELNVADPLLELRLFAGRGFLIPNLLMSLVFFSFAGINYLLPFYLKYVGGYTTSDAGLILTSLSVALMAGGMAAGLLYNRFGPRPITIVAGFFLIAGYFLMTRLTVETGTIFIITSLVLVGLGLGLMVTPLSNMTLESVSKKYQGMISSLLSLERFAPMTLGIAFFNLVFIQGVISMAGHTGITKESPADVVVSLLAKGFDFTFLFTLAVGIIVLALAFMARHVIHPDYQSSEDDERESVGLI